MITKHQQKQLKELRSNKENAYVEASIYTILLDLCEGNGVDDVFMMLHNVATDLYQRELLESKYQDSLTWKW